jgi:hypothetical protein
MKKILSTLSTLFAIGIACLITACTDSVDRQNAVIRLFPNAQIYQISSYQYIIKDNNTVYYWNLLDDNEYRLQDTNRIVRCFPQQIGEKQ